MLNCLVVKNIRLVIKKANISRAAVIQACFNFKSSAGKHAQIGDTAGHTGLIERIGVYHSTRFLASVIKNELIL